MARLAGRNTSAAWLVGIICVFVIAAAIGLAAPAIPAVGDWVDSLVNGIGDFLRETFPAS